MSVLENFGQWKGFLADRLHNAESEGIQGKVANEMAFRIGDYLSEQVEPQNNEERLLRELWEAGTEEEQHVLANLMIKIVDDEGSQH